MIVALTLGVTVAPNGHAMLVRVWCRWCRRQHVHAILRGDADVQVPSCGTPTSYLVTAQRRNHP